MKLRVQLKSILALYNRNGSSLHMKCEDRYIGQSFRLAAVALVALAASPWSASAVDSEPRLSKKQVETIIAQGAAYASRVNLNSVIAVVDREGFVLGVWNVAGGADPTAEIVAGAVSRGGTAAMLSSNQNAFTSRTAGFIIQQHFAPGVRNTTPGPLVGVGFSEFVLLGCEQIRESSPGATLRMSLPIRLILPAQFQSPGVRTEGVSFTSLADSPGGVPLFIERDVGRRRRGERGIIAQA